MPAQHGSQRRDDRNATDTRPSRRARTTDDHHHDAIIDALGASHFDEVEFFRAVHRSGARALLIGRRALVFLGLPVLTAAYDFWLAIDDITAFNAVGERFEHRPTCTPEEARLRGRYVLENDEHIDVLVARNVTTLDGQVVAFDALWARKREIAREQEPVSLPSVEDLILTKQINPRPKDLEDIRLLRILKEQRT